MTITDRGPNAGMRLIWTVLVLLVAACSSDPPARSSGTGGDVGSGAGTQTGATTGTIGSTVSGSGPASSGSTAAGGSSAGVGTGSTGGMGAGGSTGAGGASASPPYRDAGLLMIPDSALSPGAPVGNRAISAGSVPPNAAGLFGAAMQGAGPAPTLAYPAPQTMFPPNIARILFQWTAPPSSNVFRLHFDSGRGTLDVYTDGVQETCVRADMGAKCWESAADTLMPYLAAAAGGTLRFDIAAMNGAAPTTFTKSATYEVRIAPHQVGGAIYYWSTTAQGIRRGTLDGRPAADYLTPPVAKGQCVACHTLSRSGKHLTIALPGDLLGLVDVVDTIPPILFGPSTQGFPGQNIAASWATFSPDETRIVVAGQGALSVRDATTAQIVGTPIALPTGMTGSMPDWAPDGQHLVFASSMNATVDRLARHLQGSSISWLSAAGNGFAGLATIAASRGVVSNTCVGRESFANPMFSPDSRWLVFSRGDCESEMDPTSEVILATAAPNAQRYALTRANTQVGDKMLTSQQNGMPTWAPSHDTDIGWIAFTSVRDYGLVLTQGSKIGAQLRQLWIAAIDFKAIGNADASFPAFRLPAQDLDENNHRPFWTVDVLPPDWKPPIVR